MSAHTNFGSLTTLNNLPQMPMISRALIDCAAIYALWSRNRLTRKHLSRLTDDQLADIGLTRIEVMREIKKPFFMM